MEIRQLRYFLDIAQTEHLTQSAQNLFVTQSTLSHGLRQLEQELNVTLFDRLGRGLKLSQAGAEFRVYATRALKEIEAGRMPLALLPRSFATRRLIDASLRQADVAPTVRVEMDSVEALLGVCRHSDLASIVPERAARQAPDLHAIELTEPQMVRHAGILWRRGASRSAAARAFAALLLTTPLR